MLILGFLVLCADGDCIENIVTALFLHDVLRLGNQRAYLHTVADALVCICFPFEMFYLKEFDVVMLQLFVTDL